jgi:uncharacterized membrane protein
VKETPLPDIAEEVETELEVKDEPVEPAVPDEERAAKHRDRTFLILLLLIIAAYLATFVTLTLLRYSNFRGSEFDTAIFNQVVWLMSRFKGAYSTIRGTNLFGDHFAPILFFLTPIYWLRGNAPALITVQTVALGLGAVPVYLLAKEKLESGWVALALASTFLLYPALQHVNLADFHPESLGLLFLLFAFYAIVKKKFAWFYVLCLLAAFCKEDMVLAVLVLGILVYFLFDKRAGLIVAVGSLVYFLAAVLFFIPHFAPAGYQYSGRLRAFGATPKEALKNFFLHPGHTINVLATRQNLKYVFDLLIPVAFISVFAPVFLLPALPAFFLNIISDFAPQHTIGTIGSPVQYTAAIIPFVFIAAIYGIKRFKKWSEGAFRARFVVGGVAVIVLVCAIAGNFYLSPSPLAAGFQGSSYNSDRHITAIRNGLKLIPADASVSAQTFMLAHLSSREKIYQFPEPFAYLMVPSDYKMLGKVMATTESDAVKIIFPNSYRAKNKGRGIAPRYVVLDTGGQVSITRDMYDRLVTRLQVLAGYRPIYTRDGVLVLKKT